MHIKAEGMTQFDIFHIFIENSVNSELLFFWALLKLAKIWNYSKNAQVWAAQFKEFLKILSFLGL